MLNGATPLFLIGCPRSGTTFLTRILNAHSKILLTNETAAFLLLDDIAKKSRKGIASGLMYWKTCNLTLSDFVDKEYRSFLTRFYEDIAMEQNKPDVLFWGEKHPHLSLCLDRVCRHFPEAHYIYMIRDPRDSALSIAKMAQSDFLSALRGWMGTSRIYEVFAAQIANGHLHQLKYEDLVGDPAGTTDGILRRLGLTTTPEVRILLRLHVTSMPMLPAPAVTFRERPSVAGRGSSPGSKTKRPWGWSRGFWTATATLTSRSRLQRANTRHHRRRVRRPTIECPVASP